MEHQKEPKKLTSFYGSYEDRMMPNDLPATLDMQEDIEKNIDIAYEYFALYLKDKASRPTLFGKMVYIDISEYIDEKPIGFWHLISLKELNTEILPCNNDHAVSLCKQNCITMKRFVFLKRHEEARAICIYRASRLPWIVEIICLANVKSEKIKCWLISDKNSSKLYIRYQQGATDFILILKEEKTMYRLTSAFPVFNVSDMKQFAQGFKDHKWEYSE